MSGILPVSSLENLSFLFSWYADPVILSYNREIMVILPGINPDL